MGYVWGNMCLFCNIFGNIDKSNSPSIVGLIISPIRFFSLIIFGFDHTLFRWVDTAIKFPVHPDQLLWNFSLLFLVYFLWLALEQDNYIHTYFQIYCKF